MIKFGTDGWRGIMAEDFTFGNVRKVTQAIANYLKLNKRKEGKIKVIIGYDNRFLSDEFAKSAAQILVNNDIIALVVNNATPTPVIAYAVKDLAADGAIMITASHNPPLYNGIKFIPYYAGPALPDVTDEIMNQLSRIDKGDPKISDERTGEIIYFDPKPSYLSHLEDVVNTSLLKETKLKIVVNPMYGAGVGYLDEILSSYGIEVCAINNHRDVLFGNAMPEPREGHLDDLIDKMTEVGADLGLALDGDADRLAVVDREGYFISPNQIIYLLMKYMIEEKGYDGTVARTVATTHMIDRIASRYGIKVKETPVGFKYIGESMMIDDAFLGGEESGGLSVSGHVPEKDGILAALLVIEMMTAYMQSPTEMLINIQNEYGPVFSNRLDMKCDDSEKENIIKMLDEFDFKEIAGRKIVSRKRIDGLKLILERGAWVLIRSSGTESVFRIYAEADNKESVVNIQKDICDKLKLNYEGI